MAEARTVDQTGRVFILKGGTRHGQKVRLYPNNSRQVRQGKPAYFDDLDYSTESYVMPSGPDQNPDKPYMLWVP